MRTIQIYKNIIRLNWERLAIPGVVKAEILTPILHAAFSKPLLDGFSLHPVHQHRMVFLCSHPQTQSNSSCYI